MNTDTIIDIPQNIILFKTNDNMIFELTDNIYTNSNMKRLVQGKISDTTINKVDENSKMFSHIVKVLDNPVVDDWEPEYDLIVKKYGINIRPSLYCWLSDTKMYTDFDYQHSSKILSVLCNNNYIVFNDISGNVFFCNRNEKCVYNTGIVSKYTPNFALHPTLPLLAISNDSRKQVIIINLQNHITTKLDLNYIIASSIIYPAIDWQNDVLFVKNLYLQTYHCYKLCNNELKEIPHIKYEYKLLLNTNKIRIEKERDALYIYNSFKKFKLADVGEKCKFDYSDEILVYTNYNHLTIFILNK